jgi:M6 family metalloprotease-like protein
LCALSATVLPVALALEPPRPGEIERLRQEGTLEKSLEFAKSLGNDQIDPALVERMKYKIAQIRGKGVLAPPPDWRGMPTTGNVRIFALLIDFPDYPHTVPASTVDSMLFGAGNPANFPVESLTNYYHRSSYGLLDLDGVTLGWYRAPYNRSVVEGMGTPDNLIKEALNSFDATHDFSVYDYNSDGTIDYFVVMYAGPHGDFGSLLWGYQTSFGDYGYLLDGKHLGKYSWQWESEVPDVVIHETGHALGLPDLYDGDHTVGPRGGVGSFDPMGSSGLYDHNSFSKWILDWLTPSVVSGLEQTRTLNPLSEQPEALLVWPGGDLGNPFSEYFLVENRQSVANDNVGFLPNGLAIWHVDATLLGGSYRYNNQTTSHKLLRLMEADGLEQIEGQPADADNGDLYNEGDSFSQDTHPSSAKYDGTDSCVTVGSIIDLGDDARMTASIGTTCGPNPRVEYDSIELPLVEVVGNGDGVVQRGETWSVRPNLRNGGGGTALDVKARLESTTAGVTILDSGPRPYGDIAPGANAPVASGYRFALDPSSCTPEIAFDVVDITSTNAPGVYPYKPAAFTVPSVCPLLRFASFSNLIEIEGNGNGGIDPGETWELSVNLSNVGDEPALGVSADLVPDAGSPISVTMLQAGSTYNNIPVGATTSSNQAYRFRVDISAPCGEWISLGLVARSANPANSYPTEAGAIRLLVGGTGPAVPVFKDDFEQPQGWEFNGASANDWQIDIPQGLGGPLPDPSGGYDGPHVMGSDLTGVGLVPGNYENDVYHYSISRPFDFSRLRHLSVSYARWLNVGYGDSAQFVIWHNYGSPDGRGLRLYQSSDAADSSWVPNESNKFDISDFADGRNPIRFAFEIGSDSQATSSGWNIDAFEIHGVPIESCEPYVPSTLPGEASNLRVGKGAPGQLTLNWNADCGAATTYGIYRGDLKVGYSSIGAEPGACDVTGTGTTIPLGSGDAEFFLVVPHKDGEEGSYGTGTNGTPRVPAALWCYPQGSVAACAP